VVQWLPDGEEIMTLAFFVLTQYRRVADRQTDRQTDSHVAIPITRASIASRGQKYNHGTTEYRGIFSRYLPWSKISGTAQHYPENPLLYVKIARISRI